MADIPSHKTDFTNKGLEIRNILMTFEEETSNFTVTYVYSYYKAYSMQFSSLDMKQEVESLTPPVCYYFLTLELNLSIFIYIL